MDYRTDQPRSTHILTIKIACHAPQEVFAEDEATIPAHLMAVIVRAHGLGCDGGGVPGSWCEVHNCPFARIQSLSELV